MTIKTICCICHKTKSLNGWLDSFIHQYKSLSHGYCPECFEKTMRELDLKNDDKRENQGLNTSCEIAN